MHETSIVYALDVWERLKKGECVVVSDETLDKLAEHFADREDDEARRYFGELSTTNNPKRVGIRDAYIAFLPDLQTPETLAELRKHATKY